MKLLASNMFNSVLYTTNTVVLLVIYTKSMSATYKQIVVNTFLFAHFHLVALAILASFILDVIIIVEISEDVAYLNLLHRKVFNVL